MTAWGPPRSSTFKTGKYQAKSGSYRAVTCNSQTARDLQTINPAVEKHVVETWELPSLQQGGFHMTAAICKQTTSFPNFQKISTADKSSVNITLTASDCVESWKISLNLPTKWAKCLLCCQEAVTFSYRMYYYTVYTVYCLTHTSDCISRNECRRWGHFTKALDN